VEIPMQPNHSIGIELRCQTVQYHHTVQQRSLINSDSSELLVQTDYNTCWTNNVQHILNLCCQTINMVVHTVDGSGNSFGLARPEGSLDMTMQERIRERKYTNKCQATLCKPLGQYEARPSRNLECVKQLR